MMTCEILTVPIYFVFILAGIGSYILADGDQCSQMVEKIRRDTKKWKRKKKNNKVHRAEIKDKRFKIILNYANLNTKAMNK